VPGPTATRTSPPKADRLGPYRAKRDFGVTPEPRGASAPASPGRAGDGRFVVQLHRATSRHYDFRLEMGGVLVSWAVPRGPSLDPARRRLAVRVEDHPLDYFAFEGVIPRGGYGAGDVIIWDWGTYEADPETPDPERAIADGEFKFRLNGAKLRGGFVVVRTAGFGRRDDRREKWLLIHRRDAEAVDTAEWEPGSEPRSVKTGRTNDEVAAGRR